jgi:hypothetical protein
LLILHLFFFRPFFVMERCMEGYIWSKHGILWWW